MTSCRSSLLSSSRSISYQMPSRAKDTRSVAGVPSRSSTSTTCLRRLTRSGYVAELSALELVAEAADRLQVHRRTRLGLDLRAQPLDMDVEGLRVADVVRAPDPVDQLLAGEHAADVAQQQLEQLELLQRQLHRLPRHRDQV